MQGKVTLRDVKDGIATVEDLLTINALLDMTADIEAAEYDKTKEK